MKNIKFFVILLMMLSFLIYAKRQESKYIRTIELEGDMDFHPKIHKPNVLSALKRKKLKIKSLKKDKDLIPSVIKSVNNKPF